MKKLAVCLLIVINTLWLTGCWDRMEINDLAIVTAVGVDKLEDGHICLTLLIPAPRLFPSAGGGGGGDGGDKAPTIVMSEYGKTIMDAFRRLQEKSSREIMFSHVRFIVLSERLARSGVNEALDFFSRYRQSNLRAHVLVTQDDIAELMASDPGIERTVSDLIHEEGEMGISVRIDLKDFIAMLTEEGINPVAGRIEMVPLVMERKKKDEEKNEGNGQENGQKKNQENGQENPKKPKKTLAIRGAAIFHKDKLVGWMNDAEARGLVWLRDEMEQGVITVAIPEEKGGGRISVRLKEAKVKFKPQIEAETLHMSLTIITQAVVYESSSKIDLSDPKSVVYIEDAVGDKIQKRVERALVMLQKQFRSDTVGFGTALYRQYPKEWLHAYKDTWDELFPELDIPVAINVRIPRVGFVTKSLTREESEFVK
ncbi:Ger(x)C family spore germination protein [Propionispora hippei]|uniref:Spore germination protein KC n=1 Tax=Propionispora hippei DSM 15287 TaxID=1123003 RepID=A0A1M6J8A1_9FIRM|nr:Ger(x)C family spore germination protein [Propionispora hippei]SHJ42928.1 spore germination protein KC [Propionispora hippei DSM 15287]